MKSLKFFILSLILILTLSTGVSAEYFSDIIVTGTNGIWTDSRSYSTLNDAITAIGANQRTLVIASPQTVTTLTVPANVTLKFEKNGSITNSDQLTINTKNIIADNRQIFTGAGNIDFASGTIVKSGWFNSIESAFALTVNDTVTLVVTKPQTITASYSPGDNVHLKWESPGNILTVNGGVTVGNINQVTAGNYQLFAGAGNFRFLDGVNLNSSWFSNLRSIITWVSTNRVTLTIQGTLLVDFTDTVPTNLHIDVDSQRGILSVSGGVTLTINSNIQAGPYQWFSGAGTVVLPSVVQHYPEWYSSGTFTQATITAALSAVGTTNNVTLLLRPGTWVISSNADWSAYTNVNFKVSAGAILQIATGTSTTISGTVEAGLYQIFSCTGTGRVYFNGPIGVYHPEWWGVKMYSTIAAAVASGSAAANTTALQTAIYCIAGSHYDAPYQSGWGTIELSHGVLITGEIDVQDMPGISFKGQGKSSTTWCSSGVVNPLLKMGKSTNVAGSYHFSIADIRFEGLAGCNNILYISYAAYFSIDRCYFTGSSVTLLSSYGSLSYTLKENNFQGGTFYAIDIDGNNTTGDTANNITLLQNEISATGVGLRFRAGNMLRIYGGAIEGCGTGGVVIEDTNTDGHGISAILDGVWFESNVGKAIALGSGDGYRNNVTLRDLIIVGNGTTSTYGIYADGGVSGIQINAERVTGQNVSVKDFYATGSVSGVLNDCAFASYTGVASILYNTNPSAAEGARWSNLYMAQARANLAAGDNPSVIYGYLYLTNNGGATNVTTLANGEDGQIVYIWGGDGGNTTFKHGTGANKISINAGSDVTLANGKSLILMFIATQWYEIGGLR